MDGRRGRAPLPAVPAAFTVLVLCGFVGGEAARPWPDSVPPLVCGALAYTVFANFLLAFGCFTWLLDNRPAEQVATYAYVDPLVAVLLGWLLAGEVLTLGIGLAAAPILGAVAVSVSRPA